MPENAPWDDIATPPRGYYVRYVTAKPAVNLCWGKDVEGRCLFIVELEGDHTELFRERFIRVSGIEVDLRDLRDETQGLILTLGKHIDRDIFFALCQTLITSLEPLFDPGAALGVTFKHIQRWKHFLAGKRPRILSPQEIRGLFAELCFLSLLKEKCSEDVQAVEAWGGPDRIHHDFIFNHTAVEVKSISGRDRSVVRISSEDQLETVSEQLFLKVYRLTDSRDQTLGQSLNEVVSEIANELDSIEAVEEYWRKLATCGYVELREYDKPKFIVHGSNAFRVTTGFPRLQRSALPDGVVDVKYKIQLEKIAPFECDQSEIWEE